ARFSALERSYQYCIDNRAVSSVLLMQNHTWIYGKLDEVAMHAAGQYLMGKHDFTSYRAIKCQAHTPIREITHLSVYREGDRVLMDITANAFLHHMVRNIMGVLLEIGWGKKPPEWAEQVLHARDRTQAGVTAEPTGLRLTKVGYPSHFNLPNEVSYST
ncbi:MAG: tRNA pseudouridine(38-40) synthase TruA, partial [Methylococcales bacterium]|nr:tRNA pseudouridine(38-40) synthase TruA [Methylococcales bacterium]